MIEVSISVTVRRLLGDFPGRELGGSRAENALYNASQDHALKNCHSVVTPRQLYKRGRNSPPRSPLRILALWHSECLCQYR